MEVENLFGGFAELGGPEVVHRLLQTETVRIERIASRAQASPEGFWYDQSEQEWVILLRGSATLGLAEDQSLDLRAGDYLLIPAHCKHRVDRVSEDALWLAVHFP